jgi:stress response protein YsnF
MKLTNLFRISDFEPQYRQSFEDADILRFEVLTSQQEKAGRVSDILMDDIGQLYYLVVDIGSWFNYKLVLVAPEQFRIDRSLQQIHLVGLTKKQVHSLPPYTEERTTRMENRPAADSSPYSAVGLNSIPPIEASSPLEASPPLEAARIQPEQAMHRYQEQAIQPVSVSTSQVSPQSKENLTSFENSPLLPPKVTSEVISQETIPLLEERLIVNQKRRKIGEVVFRKQIETRIIEVPIRREKLVIEQISPELKQLAIVDLPSEQLSDIELMEVAASALETAKDNEFISIEVAHQILLKVAQRLSPSTPKVKLVFEDSQLQTDYQHYLRKNLS